MSDSSVSGGGGPVTTTTVTTGGVIPLAEFNINKDNPAKLSWLDRKALARRLGCAVDNRTTWEGLRPGLIRRLEALRGAKSPTKDADAVKEAALNRLRRRKRKREEEEIHDRELLDSLIGGSGGGAGEREEGETSAGAISSSRSVIGIGGKSSPIVIKDNNGTLPPPNSIPYLIKSGRGRAGRKTKEGKKMFEMMQAELQMVRDELVPLQLAEALFDFNISQLINYAVILIPAVQRRYVLSKRKKKESRESKKRDMLEQLLERSLEEDREASDMVATNTMQEVIVYVTVVTKYVVPLVRMAWDPLLENPMSADNITDIPGWRAILEAMWEDLSMKVMSVAANFTAVRSLLGNLDLKARFEGKKSTLIFSLVAAGDRARPSPDLRKSQKGKVGSGGAKSFKRGEGTANEQARDRAFERLRSIFGPDTVFGPGFFKKFKESKHGPGTCLVGCMDARACKKGAGCAWSHDYQKSFPKGDRCVKGDCDCVV